MNGCGEALMRQLMRLSNRSAMGQRATDGLEFEKAFKYLEETEMPKERGPLDRFFVPGPAAGPSVIARPTPDIDCRWRLRRWDARHRSTAWTAANP